MSSYNDLYAVLGLDDNATKEEIKRAYRQLAMKWHPDKNPDQKEYAEIRFKQITDAYKVLIDDEERKKYENHGPGHHHVFTRTGMDDLFNRFYGPNKCTTTRPKPNIPHPRFGPTTPPPASYSRRFNPAEAPNVPRYNRSAFASANASDVDEEEEDTLGSLYGDINVKVYCTLEELYTGVKKLMKVARCRDGVMENKNCVVTLYPGIATGTEILAPGQGNKCKDKEPDNIIFKVLEIPHARFKRVGDNIEETVSITLKESLLGFKLDIKAIDGDPVTIDIDGPISSGYQHIVHLRGMPVAKTDKRGDYIITFKVILPEKLTPEQRNAIETLF